MSKGWRFESDRHALASRGIPSSDKTIARHYITIEREDITDLERKENFNAMCIISAATGFILVKPDTEEFYRWVEDRLGRDIEIGVESFWKELRANIKPEELYEAIETLNRNLHLKEGKINV